MEAAGQTPNSGYLFWYPSSTVSCRAKPYWQNESGHNQRWLWVHGVSGIPVWVWSFLLHKPLLSQI